VAQQLGQLVAQRGIVEARKEFALLRLVEARARRG